MNKKDLIPVILLALLIPLWITVDRHFIAPKYPQPVTVPVEQQTETAAAEELASLQAESEPAALSEQAVPEVASPPVEETVASLQNEMLQLQLTSIGGGIKSATLLNYPEFNEDASPPVALDFTNSPALVYDGLPGMGAGSAFNLEVSDNGHRARITKELAGLVFERTITLGDDYLLKITDRFMASASGPVTLPDFRILTGWMQNPADMKATKGISLLGVDSYSSAGINYWGRKLNKMYKQANGPDVLDAVPEDMRDTEVDWVSAKNKFFTQILKSDEPMATMAILSTRDMSQKGVVPRDIAAALSFKSSQIAAGDALQLEYTYYIGPKQYSILKDAGNHMEGVMEFETIGKFAWMNWMMEPARKTLLWSLNHLNGLFHNYGVAIILLTILVRIIFWPLTHKSTEKMRENSEKMQLVQPKVKVIQEKYKGNAAKIQQETMKVYQEHGFNPMGMMGGCLPMLLQMPVLFALFSVLRNAIELRYAGFLWIADLSAPENLLMGKVPFIHSLNLLPFVMAASMVWQQKLSSPTTTAATPEQQQQQKMMMIMMPVMMLFFFYSMPSGLVLYFTISNISMITQTIIRNFRQKKREA